MRFGLKAGLNLRTRWSFTINIMPHDRHHCILHFDFKFLYFFNHDIIIFAGQLTGRPWTVIWDHSISHPQGQMLVSDAKGKLCWWGCICAAISWARRGQNTLIERQQFNITASLRSAHLDSLVTVSVNSFTLVYVWSLYLTSNMSYLKRMKTQLSTAPSSGQICKESIWGWDNMFCTELFESQDFVVVVVVMKKLLKPQDRLLKSSESKAISLKTTCGLGSKYINK